MPLCVLCQKREADKTGSHIVPAFMLVSLIGKRNKEIGFQISSKGYVNKYIGREVSAETISELLDRELTDEDIESNENLFTVDNLLCTECENRLGVIESACAAEIKKIKEGSIELQKGKQIDYFEHDANLVLRCLFYSILLRIAAANDYEYNLNPTLRERIRLLLEKTLSLDPKLLDANLLKYKSEIVGIPLSIFYSPLDADDDGGTQIYTHKPLSIPSLIIVNEFILCSYNSKPQTNFDFGSVFTINKNIVQEILNFNEAILRIGYLTPRKNINDSLNEVLVHHMFQNLSNTYRQISIETKGVNPSNAEIQAFISDIANDETDLADRLTPPFLAKKMMKHLS